ncbi:MAG TPA: hypothetical protein VGM05_20040, partial [Planctomycetaceae bacterium]
MTDRKKPGWAFWMAVVFLSSPVLYVLSFGPACWLCAKGILGQRPAWIAFRPVTWLACNGPIRLREAIESYAIACGDKRRLARKFTLMPMPERYVNLGPTAFWEHVELKCADDS